MAILNLLTNQNKIEKIIRDLGFSENNKANVIDIGGGWDARYNFASLLNIAKIDILDILPKEKAFILAPHLKTANNYFEGNCELFETFSRFKDKEYDFIITSHILEDIAENSTLLREMIRIGKAGVNFFPYKIFEFYTHSSSSREIDGIYEFDFSKVQNKKGKISLNFNIYNERHPNFFFPIFTIGGHHHHWIMDFEKDPSTNEIILNCYKKPKIPSINEISYSFIESLKSNIFNFDNIGFYWEDNFNFNRFNYSYENTMSLPLLERMCLAKEYHNFLFERLRGNYDIKFKNDIIY
jgi:hypothetical protein